MMMITDWPTFDTPLPTDLIRGDIPISGVFELEPRVHTSINTGPQMAITEAIRESPAFIQPVTSAPQLVVVGGSETTEYLRRADEYAANFKTPDRVMDRLTVADADHVDILEWLTEEPSLLVEKSMQLIIN